MTRAECETRAREAIAGEVQRLQLLGDHVGYRSLCTFAWGYMVSALKRAKPFDLAEMQTIAAALEVAIEEEITRRR